MAFIVPYIGNFIIPTDFHIFSEGLKPPTSIYIYIYIHIVIETIYRRFIDVI